MDWGLGVVMGGWVVWRSWIGGGSRNVDRRFVVPACPSLIYQGLRGLDGAVAVCLVFEEFLLQEAREVARCSSANSQDHKDECAVHTSSAAHERISTDGMVLFAEWQDVLGQARREEYLGSA